MDNITWENFLEVLHELDDTHCPTEEDIKWREEVYSELTKILNESIERRKKDV